jgi:hypothetical protein
MRLHHNNSGSAQLAVLCERRIGHPVIAAARMRVETAEGKRQTRVLAIAVNQLWWLELSAWPRRSVGRVLGWRPLDGMAAHTELQRGGGYAIELSWPTQCELYTGRLLGGEQADELVGQLTADAFARAAGGSGY